MRCKTFDRVARLFTPLSPKQQARQEFLALRLQDQDIAIDCGANVGKITRILAQQRGTIYAFEPNPYAFHLLQEHFKGAPHVHCLQKGVLDYNGVLPLYLHEKAASDQVHWSTGSSFLACKRNVTKDHYIEVEVIDLAEFIQSLHARVKILKLDVEGVECRILRKLITANVIDLIDHVFVETHAHKIPELQQETAALRQYIRDHRLTNINLDWK
jgi:FkbM family methyltransferase